MTKRGALRSSGSSISATISSTPRQQRTRMGIVDDYAAIAAELRRLRAERRSLRLMSSQNGRGMPPQGTACEKP